MAGYAFAATEMADIYKSDSSKRYYLAECLQTFQNLASDSSARACVESLFFKKRAHALFRKTVEQDTIDTFMALYMTVF